METQKNSLSEKSEKALRKMNDKIACINFKYSPLRRAMMGLGPQGRDVYLITYTVSALHEGSSTLEGPHFLNLLNNF